MALNHRSVYFSDVGLFLLLATPLLNAYVIEFVLSFGSTSFYHGDSKVVINTFVGIAGVLGLGLALLRLKVVDSRQTVIISLLVKFAAATWLLSAYMQGLSPVFLVLAVADGISAFLLFSAVVKRT
jgi:ABC-type glycerol-3-phosphate transport system permease component